MSYLIWFMDCATLLITPGSAHETRHGCVGPETCAHHHTSKETGGGLIIAVCTYTQAQIKCRSNGCRVSPCLMILHLGQTKISQCLLICRQKQSSMRIRQDDVELNNKDESEHYRATWAELLKQSLYVVCGWIGEMSCMYRKSRARLTIWFRCDGQLLQGE